MLKAQALEDRSFIFAPEIDNLDSVKGLAQSGKLVCPLCEVPVHLKAGRKKIWHFAHDMGRGCGGPDGPDYRPESREHKLLKWTLHNWLLEELHSAEVDVESRLENRFGKQQLADVLLNLGKYPVAFEIQRSHISPDEWMDRHHGYSSLGIRDEWILVGSSHVSVAEERSDSRAFKLSSLARTIVKETGRLLWIDDHMLDQLRNLSDNGPPSSRDLKIWAIEAIDGHYFHDMGKNPAHVENLHGRPSGPEDLGKMLLWREKAQHSPLVVRKEAHERLLLLDFRIDKECPVVAMESPVVHADGLQDAWIWEEKNRAWIDRWESERKSTENAEDAGSSSQSTPDPGSKPGALAEIGEAVWDTLPDLLPLLRQVRKTAPADDPKGLKKHFSLPEGVRKWGLNYWTPLTDLEIPIDWIFGCDRRLWQMRVYCSLFYASYAKKFWWRQGRKDPPYSRIKTELGLRALSEKDLIRDMAQVRSDLQSINRRVYEILHDHSWPLNWTGRGSIELRSVRHLVMASYFERLRDLGFLSRRDSPPVDPCWWARCIEVVLDFDSRLQQRGNRPVSASFLEKIARRWLEVAWLCRKASESTYVLTNFSCQPYFEGQYGEKITEALKKGKLHITESAIYSHQPELILKTG